MKNILSKDDLNSLCVYEVRELAREVGVNSPTSKKKAILIEEILKIVSGKQKAVSNSNQGRPPKSLKNRKSTIYSLIPKELIEFAKENNKVKDIEDYNGNLVFEQTHVSFGDSKDTSGCCGYLKKIIGDNYYIAYYDISEDVNVFIYVPIDFVNKYTLRIGDKIEGIAYLLKDKTCSMLQEINKINDVEVADFVRKDIDITNSILPKNNISIFNKNINQGKRFYSVCDDRFEVIEKIVDFIDHHNEMKFVVYGLDMVPEIYHFLKVRKQVELFATVFTDDIKVSYGKTIDCLNYCNTMLKDGNDIILINFDILASLKSLDSYYAQEYNIKNTGFKVDTVKLIKKIIGLGSQYNGASLTDFSFFFEESPMLTEFKNLFSESFEL